MTNATAHHWWEHNIGSGHGLVPSGTKPLPGLMLTPICIALWHHFATTSQWRCWFNTALNWNIYVCFSIYAFFTHCGKYTYSTGTHHYRPLRAHSRIPNMYSLCSFGIWGWFDILKVNIASNLLKKDYIMTFEIMIFITRVIITRVSEVIMFSPCVFVCLWLCLCLYPDVCPDDLTMKDWCHINIFCRYLVGDV